MDNIKEDYMLKTPVDLTVMNRLLKTKDNKIQQLEQKNKELEEKIVNRDAEKEVLFEKIATWENTFDNRGDKIQALEQRLACAEELINDMSEKLPDGYSVLDERAQRFLTGEK